jgi:hypothetical protein
MRLNIFLSRSSLKFEHHDIIAYQPYSCIIANEIVFFLRMPKRGMPIIGIIPFPKH